MECVQCSIELTSENWLPCREKRNHRICAQCIRADNTRRYQVKKRNYLATYKLARANTKIEIFTYYGGECQICGEKDFDKLSLDHIDGNGRKHRKEVLGTDSGSAFYQWILKNKSNNIRLLCFNCNCQIDMTQKELFISYDIGCKYCGNENIYRSNTCSQCFQITKRNKYIDLKIEVFDHYGGQCVCCGEYDIKYLTMDHINNDGAAHRKQIGTEIFPWLKRNNYPSNFQILCFNCNYVKGNLK